MFARLFPPRLQSLSSSTRCFHHQYHQLPRRHVAALPLPHSRSRGRNASTWTSARSLYRDNPITLPLALLSIGIGIGCLIWTINIYSTTIAPINAAFPDPIANKVRRALYYSNVDVQPQKALDHYKAALEMAAAAGMDPLGDPILGLKITLAAFLEKLRQDRVAITVLEALLADCGRAVQAIERGDGGGGGRDSGDNNNNDDSEASEPLPSSGAETHYHSLQALRQRRTHLLGKTVGIGVKLGELYAGDAVGDTEAAERSLVTAVETSIREQQRRQEAGITSEEEGPWLSDEEIGATLESLATHYEQQSKHYLSAPLYLRALTLCSPSSRCHAAVLMNNLSISLAQQVIPASTSANANSSLPPPTRTQQLTTARAWAEKAIATATATTATTAKDEQPATPNAECEEACAVATLNLAELAEMQEAFEEARRRFVEGAGLARKIGLTEGEQRAEEGLRRLENRVGSGDG